jgi:hypothetical protein
MDEMAVDATREAVSFLYCGHAEVAAFKHIGGSIS